MYFRYHFNENNFSIIFLPFIKSSKVSNKGTTLNLLLILASFCKYITDKISEADDVIASIVINNSKNTNPEPTLILSADKDFIQLHKYSFVRQYDPIRNKWITHNNPVMFLQEHIIKGDRSDGIPNILTCDDAIVTGKAQKKMSKEKITSLASMNPQDFTNFIRLRNWKRNSQLIDLEQIPEEVVNKILVTYETTTTPDCISIDYFISNNIQDIIEEFS